jgi:hypothetical protein
MIVKNTHPKGESSYMNTTKKTLESCWKSLQIKIKVPAVCPKCKGEKMASNKEYSPRFKTSVCLYCHGYGKVLKSMMLYVPTIKLPGDKKRQEYKRQWRLSHKEIIKEINKRNRTSDAQKRAVKKYRRKWDQLPHRKLYMENYRKTHPLTKKNNVSTIVYT